MLLVDKAMMYESSALNKNLTCQMSPLIISFNTCLVQVQLLSMTLHGLVLWGKRGPPLVPTCRQFTALKAASKAV